MHWSWRRGPRGASSRRDLDGRLEAGQVPGRQRRAVGRDGILEMHEVKGFWQDDARVKIKVAASIYPFRFVAVKARAKKHGGGWEVENF